MLLHPWCPPGPRQSLVSAVDKCSQALNQITCHELHTCVVTLELFGPEPVGVQPERKETARV